MNTWSRRSMVAVGVLAAVGGTAPRLFFHQQYHRKPYDDILVHLKAREAGAQVGAAVIARLDGFDIHNVAERLRAALKTTPLAALALADVAEGRTLEAGGWVLPESLALLCAVAAKA